MAYVKRKRRRRLRSDAPLAQKPGRVRRLELLYTAFRNGPWGGLGVNVEGHMRLDKDMLRLVGEGRLHMVRRKLGCFQGRQYTGRITRLQITARGLEDLLIAGYDIVEA